MSRLHVLIVDQSQLFREGLEQLLRSGKFIVTESAKTTRDLHFHSDPGVPELLIFGFGGRAELQVQLDRVCQVRAEAPPLRVVVLTPLLDRDLILAAAAAGADAVLSKDISGEVLRRTLELVMLGQQVFPPITPEKGTEAEQDVLLPTSGALALERSEARNAPAHLSQRASSPVVPTLLGIDGSCHAKARFSEREDQILRRLFVGAPNKVIARDLGITEATVKVHVKSLCRKLGASNRTQVAIRGAPTIGLLGPHLDES